MSQNHLPKELPKRCFVPELWRWFFISCSCLKKLCTGLLGLLYLVQWSQHEQINMTSEGKTMVCDYSLHHCRKGDSLSISLSCRVWVDSAVQKAVMTIWRLSCLTQNLTFSEWLILGGISGDHLVWLLCSEQGHRRLSRTVHLSFEYFQRWSLYSLSEKQGHWMLLRRAWLHLLHLLSHWWAPPSFFFPRLNSPSSTILSLDDRCSCALIISVVLPWSHSSI